MPIVPFHAPVQDGRAIYRNASPAVAEVVAGTRHGTCFAVANGRIALTGADLVGQEKTVTVVQDERRIVALVAYRDPSRDVAVLSLTRPLGGTIPLGEGTPIEIGAPLLLVRGTSGEAGPLGKVLFGGYRATDVGKLLRLEAAPDSESAGAPVLDEAGRAVGMVASPTGIGGVKGARYAVGTAALRAGIDGSGLYEEEAPRARPIPSDHDEAAPARSPEPSRAEPSPLERFRSDMDWAKWTFYLSPLALRVIPRLDAGGLRFNTNALYALHGYRFKDEALRVFFSGCAWYRPVTSSMSGAERRMSPRAKAVLAALGRERKRRG